MVLLKSETNRSKWPLAKVIRIFPDEESLVRKVELLLRRDGKMIQLQRLVSKLVLLLESENELDPNRLNRFPDEEPSEQDALAS